MSFFQNACKPRGLGGAIMLNRMNAGHAPLSVWGLEHLRIRPGDKCLDLGCGGGANLKRLLELVPQGQVKGLDYSQLSVEKSIAMNEKAIQTGRCVVLKGDVMNLMFSKNYFDVVTAFETIYFWPDIRKAFREVHRVLAEGGTFLICNEADGDDPKDYKWTEKIEGMTIYKDHELEGALREAGFTDIQMEKNHKHWIAITARK